MHAKMKYLSLSPSSTKCKQNNFKIFIIIYHMNTTSKIIIIIIIRNKAHLFGNDCNKIKGKFNQKADYRRGVLSLLN